MTPVQNVKNIYYVRNKREQTHITQNVKVMFFFINTLHDTRKIQLSIWFCNVIYIVSIYIVSELLLKAAGVCSADVHRCFHL